MTPSPIAGQRVVVGGGCGFFGSYLVPVLVAAGARVRVVDNLVNGDPAQLASVSQSIETITGDLRDRALCDEALGGHDVFINLAANASGIEFSRKHHGQMLVDNVMCGLVPLEAAQRQDVKRVVVTSSACVYRDDVPVPTKEEHAFGGTPELVNEGYGWAKRVQELAAGYFAADCGMNITILRPFNLYGANYMVRSLARAHVIPALVRRVLDGEDPLVVWGSGTQSRNFLHGRDAAEIVLRIITSGAGGPVNVGYEDEITIAELATLICDVAGRRPQIVFDRSRPDGQARKAADSTRLRALTGDYRPRVTLRQGIEEIVERYSRESVLSTGA
jgi:nucleoside-diphosphate-sugar epimerase